MGITSFVSLCREEKHKGRTFRGAAPRRSNAGRDRCGWFLFAPLATICCSRMMLLFLSFPRDATDIILRCSSAMMTKGKLHYFVLNRSVTALLLDEDDAFRSMHFPVLFKSQRKVFEFYSIFGLWETLWSCHLMIPYKWKKYSYDW